MDWSADLPFEDGGGALRGLLGLRYLIRLVRSPLANIIPFRVIEHVLCATGCHILRYHPNFGNIQWMFMSGGLV